MTSAIFTALLALAAGDADATKKDGSEQAEPKQILTTVSLAGSGDAATKAAMEQRGVVEHPAPAMPPLVATVQPDGSLRLGHGHHPAEAAAAEKPE